MSTMDTPTTPATSPATDPPVRPAAARSVRSRWRLDPARSRVAFRTGSLWGLVTVEGEFGHFEGTLDFTRDPAIELTIDAASLTTHNRLRDRHLRSHDFFDVADHPTVRFTSEAAALEGERLKVRGRLEAGGGAIALSLEATVRRDGDELELTATTTADHERLGMSSGLLGMIHTPSELIVEGRLIP